MPFMGREVTAQSHKCVQALRPFWAEWGDIVQGIWWEEVGRSPVPLALSCPLAQAQCSFAGAAIWGAGH